MRAEKNLPNPEGVEPFQGSSDCFLAIFSRGCTPGYGVEPIQGSFLTRQPFWSKLYSIRTERNYCDWVKRFVRCALSSDAVVIPFSNMFGWLSVMVYRDKPGDTVEFSC